MILGLTGGSGCGKTTALRAAEDLGSLVLDCDQIYHRLLTESEILINSIDLRFPGTVKHGVLDRKLLGKQVFSDPQALLDLNRISHGAVRREVLRILEDRVPGQLAVVDAIGLFEGNLAELCDYTIAVTAPTEDRIRRLMARDGITEEYARNRILAQKTNEEFSEMTDYTLENLGSREEFYEKARCLIIKLMAI